MRNEAYFSYAAKTKDERNAEDGPVLRSRSATEDKRFSTIWEHPLTDFIQTHPALRIHAVNFCQRITAVIRAVRTCGYALFLGARPNCTHAAIGAVYPISLAARAVNALRGKRDIKLF
jgi:hypothetical protein